MNWIFLCYSLKKKISYMWALFKLYIVKNSITEKFSMPISISVVWLKHILKRTYFILWGMMLVFVILQNTLMVGAYFSLIGYDRKVSHLLAGIAISIADVMKGLWMLGDCGLKNNFVDYSVRKKVPLNCLIISGKSFLWFFKI